MANDVRNFYVVDSAGALRGQISVDELRPALRDPDALKDVVVAIDLANTDFLSVDIGDGLDTVMKRLDVGYRDELPVLDGGRFVGVVRSRDVISRYRREVARREAAEGESESTW